MDRRGWHGVLVKPEQLVRQHRASGGGRRHVHERQRHNRRHPCCHQQHLVHQYCRRQYCERHGVNINSAIAIINIQSDSDGNRIEAAIANTNSNLFVKSSNAGQTLTLSGAISGSNGVRIYGPGVVEYGGLSNNTYGGSTVVASNDANGSAGTLQLSSSTAGSLVPADLQIGGTASGQPANGARVKLITRDDISNASAVTIAGDGLLDLNGQNETIGSASVLGNITQGAGTLGVAGGVTLNGGSITSTGGAPLTLTSAGSVTATGSAVVTSPVKVNTGASFALPIAVNGGAVLELNGITANSSPAVSLTKSGTGVLELSGASAYTGETDVTAGTLSLNASASLVTGGLSLNGSSLLNIDVASASDGGYGSVTTVGAPVLANAGLQLTVAPGVLAPAHSRLKLIDDLGSSLANGTFLALPEGSPVAVGGRTFTLSYVGGTGNDVELSLPNAAPILATGASATPSPGVVGSPLKFSAAAADADSDALTYTWSFGDGTTGTGSTTTHAYSAPGQYVVSVSITDGFGGSLSSTTSATVNPAPSVPVLLTPALTGFAQTHTTWRAGKAAAVFAKATKRAPLGTQFSFTLNETATVSLVFTQSATGRKAGSRCVAVTTKNRKAKSCKRTLALGTLTHPGHSGKNTAAFQAPVSSAKTLKAGRYTVTATATNAAGQRSKPSSLSFTIVK